MIVTIQVTSRTILLYGLAAGDGFWHSARMNPKRLLLAMIAVFACVFITDFLIHGVWLQSRYKETMSLWRSETEMQAHMGWLMLGQFLVAATFVLVWARGFAATGRLGSACLYGMLMGIFSQAATLVTYAVQPLPADIAVKWFVSGVAQGVLVGVIVFFVYKPKSEDRKVSGTNTSPASAIRAV
jgi:hypothetical protein